MGIYTDEIIDAALITSIKQPKWDLLKSFTASDWEEGISTFTPGDSHPFDNAILAVLWQFDKSSASSTETLLFYTFLPFKHWKPKGSTAYYYSFSAEYAESSDVTSHYFAEYRLQEDRDDGGEGPLHYDCIYSAVTKVTQNPNGTISFNNFSSSTLFPVKIYQIY